MKNLEKLRKQIEKTLDQPEPLRESYLGQLSTEKLLLEAGFKQYKALVRITYNPDRKEHLGVEKIAELLRAIPAITRVNTVETDKKNNQAIYNVRAISQKPARQCFMAFKQLCLKRYVGMIVGVEIGAGSLEEKNYVK